MARTVLNRLLSDSVARYQTLFSDLTFHNHNAHHLGSLHLLGASDAQLEKAYQTMCLDMDPYEASPEQIDPSNWRKFLGNKHFCQSYRDFFKEQLACSAPNWHKRFFELLLDNAQQPMMNSVISGVAHPLIHIGYALELDSEIVAIEALTMTAVCYNFLHEVIDKLDAPQSPSKSAMDIFKGIRSDVQLPIYDKPGVGNLRPVVDTYQDAILSYYHQWRMNKDDSAKTIEDLFDLTVYIYGATHRANAIEFDFFLLHLLTSMHAIRTIAPHIDQSGLVERILQQFFFFAIAIYICQLRPEINASLIDDYEVTEEKSQWTYPIDRIFKTKMFDDSHAIKVVRALRDAEHAYGPKNGFYLKAAVKTVDHLNLDAMWIGGSSDQRQLNVLKRPVH